MVTPKTSPDVVVGGLLEPPLLPEVLEGGLLEPPPPPPPPPAELTVIINVSVSDPQLLAAEMEILKVPVSVGVPEIVAVEALKLNPLGRAPLMLKVVVVEVTPVVVAVMV